MRLFFTIIILAIFNLASGQKKFDSLQVENILTTLPGQSSDKIDDNIIKAIQAVDRKYREISDTLFGYRSLPHTIMQTILIETSDSLTINPLIFGNKIKTVSIIFNNAELNVKVERIAKSLDGKEKNKLYEYLKNNFDHFSTKEKKLNAQPVRIRYVRFPDETFAQVGIDIYGTHYLWTIDRTKEWDVVKVKELWVY
jgi:hypothetical protein